MIVDCHTHWGQAWGDLSRWLAVLDRHQVDRAFMMVTAGLFRLDQCQTDNDAVAALARQAPDRIVPLGTAWPQLGADGVAEARRCLDVLGMKGLKFHPWVQGFSVADATFGEICGLAGERQIPVFFHDGTPCYSLSEQIAGLARRFPQTPFVLGHAGILWGWRSALEATRRPNIWITLCGPHMRAFDLLCRQADPDRILWGSDFGFGLSDPIGYRLGLLRQSRVGAALQQRILGVNPLRLFSAPFSTLSTGGPR